MDCGGYLSRGGMDLAWLYYHYNHCVCCMNIAFDLVCCFNPWFVVECHPLWNRFVCLFLRFDHAQLQAFLKTNNNRLYEMGRQNCIWAGNFFHEFLTLIKLWPDCFVVKFRATFSVLL